MFGYLFSGQYGVDIFFILSGFVIYYTTKEGSCWKKFAIKRLFRIFPLYWVCLLGYSLLNGFDMNASALIRNILMMPYDGAIGYSSLVVGQAWSTCFELYFYAVFAIVLFLGLRKRYVVYLIAGLMIVGLVLRRAEVFTGYGFADYVYSLIGSSFYIVKFIFGILIAIVYRRLESVNSIGLSRVCFLLAVLASLFMLVRYNPIYAAVWSPVYFILWLMANRYIEKFSSGAVHKSMVWLGDISFSIYLVHLLVIKVIMNNFGIDDVWAVMPLALLFTICISGITYRTVEKPCMDLGKKIIGRIR